MHSIAGTGRNSASGCTRTSWSDVDIDPARPSAVNNADTASAGRLDEQVGEPKRLECLLEFGPVKLLGKSAKRFRHQDALRRVDGEGLGNSSHALLGNPTAARPTMSF